MQCTGLSAGKSYIGNTAEDLLIYEGDIIRVPPNKYGVIRFGEYQHTDAQREYQNGDLGFFIEWNGERKYLLRPDIIYWVNNEEVCIEGTVHTHPELLEGDKE